MLGTYRRWVQLLVLLCIPVIAVLCGTSCTETASELSATPDASGSSDASGPTVTLVSLGVTPSAPSLAKGTSVVLVATGVFSDDSTKDVTTTVTWSSSAPSIASIGERGLLQALTSGTSTITATSGGVTASTVVTVTDAALVSIGITPPSPTVAAGFTKQFTATGTFSNATTQDLTTQVTWSSATPATATISDAAGTKGLATSIGAGSTIISATFGTATATATLTVTSATLVSLEVTPALPSVAKGVNPQLTAKGTFTDASVDDLTTQVTWASDNTATATISNQTGTEGRATTLSPGTTTISATLGAISSSTILTVTAATLVSIDVTPDDPTVAKGLPRQFAAKGVYTDGKTEVLTDQVTWSSGTEATATISNAAGSKGLATTLAVGTSTITATFGGRSGTSTLTVTAATVASITVSPSAPSIAKGLTQQFTAQGTFTDGKVTDVTASATWSSSDTSVATVSNAVATKGLATGGDAGKTTIGAKVGVISGATDLTVTLPTLVSFTIAPLDRTVGIGSIVLFKATGTFSDGSVSDVTSDVTWQSVNTGAAVFDSAGGIWPGRAIGTLSIGATTTINASVGVLTQSTGLTLTSNCQTVAGTKWCYDTTACGESCTQVCAALGMTVAFNDSDWFAAQDTAAECQAISNAFGDFTPVEMGGWTYGCATDFGSTHYDNGGLQVSSPLRCSTYALCPQFLRANGDQGACSSNSSRAVCPCN